MWYSDQTLPWTTKKNVQNSNSLSFRQSDQKNSLNEQIPLKKKIEKKDKKKIKIKIYLKSENWMTHIASNQDYANMGPPKSITKQEKPTSFHPSNPPFNLKTPRNNHPSQVGWDTNKSKIRNPHWFRLNKNKKIKK